MRSRRSVFAVAAYLALALVGGALLAPWLHGLTQTLLPGSPLAAEPFRRYVNRAQLALAVAGLWPFLRFMGLGSLAAVGWRGGRLAWRSAGRGCLIGLAVMGALGGVSLLAGARALMPDLAAGTVLAAVGRAMVAAVAVSLLEETLFRGGLFGALRRGMPWALALLVSSAVFASLHFFEKARFEGAVRWDSGLVVLASMCRSFSSVDLMIPALLSLMLVGGSLALAYQRTGSLHFGAGMHAGWILGLQTLNAIVPPGEAAEALWGTSRAVDGWFVFVLLLACFLGLIRFLPCSAAKPAEPPAR